MFMVALLVVVVLAGTQISELFETWDNTLQTGNDIEFSLAVVALCVGTCFLLAKFLWRYSRNLISKSHPFSFQQLLLFSGCVREVWSNLLSPSPPPLRV
jgi:hypothetical protein